jgi:hypothetical protein
MKITQPETPVLIFRNFSTCALNFNSFFSPLRPFFLLLFFFFADTVWYPPGPVLPNGSQGIEFWPLSGIGISFMQKVRFSIEIGFGILKKVWICQFNFKNAKTKIRFFCLDGCVLTGVKPKPKRIGKNKTDHWSVFGIGKTDRDWFGFWFTTGLDQMGNSIAIFRSTHHTLGFSTTGQGVLI